MPKMKTKSSVKKRSNKFLRNARGTMVLCDADARIVKQFMPYSK